MRINFPPFRFVLCALCALSLWSAPAFSQHSERGAEGSSADEHTKATEHPNGVIHDWTDDHLLYPRFGPVNRLIALQKDPRAIQHWQESYRKDYGRWRSREGHRHEHGNKAAMHRDWAIPTNGVVGSSSNNAAYPAKWTFSYNETLTGGPNTGSCLTDYLVAPVNATLGAGVGQPDIVGLYNLYSGTGGTSGFCNRTTTVGFDNDVSATALFSYAVVADDGLVTTSPVTSMDGTLIAFVEQGTVSGIAHFHVLAWKQGDGVVSSVALTGNGDQDVSTNLLTTMTTFTDPAAPVAGSGTASDLALTTVATPGSTDSISSPFVEYTDDVAYVGNDAGMIFKIKNVFCPAWAPCGGASPSLDTTFGTGGVVTLSGCAGTVSGVTVDGASGNIFAGCSNGSLYAFTPTGAPVGGVNGLGVGDGGLNGGIVDPPVLDEVNGVIYTQSVNTTTPFVFQVSVTDLSLMGIAPLVGPMSFSMHAPAFNDAYFTDPTSADWVLYEYSSDNGTGASALNPGTPEIVFWGIGFNGSHVMNSGTPPVGPYPTTAADVLAFPIGQFEVSPLTEFLTTGGEDRVFASALVQFTGNLVDYYVNDLITNPASVPAGQLGGFPINSFPTNPGFESEATEGTGTSGMVIDNDSAGAGQANSIYFGVAGPGPDQLSIVKLTQAGLL